jgi:S1-C subfamily serine protease
MEFVKNDGTKVEEPLEAIAPILKATSHSWEILGTGFFVTSFGLMLTAKHLVPQGLPDADLVVFHKEFEGPALLLRRVIGTISHSTADVALLVLEPKNSETTQKRLRCSILRIGTDVPPIHSRVGCWGFPQSNLLPPGPQYDGFTVLLEREGAEGVIEAHFPNGRDRVMHPGECFQTSMNTMGGASGGPVFNERGEVFAVVSSGLDDHTTYVAPVRDLALAKICPVEGDEKMISLVEYVEWY